MDAKTHLFHYHFDGSTYSLEIIANTPEEAEERVKVISSRARYDGVLVAKIPASLGLCARLFCAVGNLLKGIHGR